MLRPEDQPLGLEALRVQRLGRHKVSLPLVGARQQVHGSKCVRMHAAERLVPDVQAVLDQLFHLFDVTLRREAFGKCLLGLTARTDAKPGFRKEIK